MLRKNYIKEDCDKSSNKEKYELKHLLQKINSRNQESRDGKTYKRASSACVHFFLHRIKYVLNFTLFCPKSDLCCNFTLHGGNTYGFKFCKF